MESTSYILDWLLDLTLRYPPASKPRSKESYVSQQNVQPPRAKVHKITQQVGPL